MKVGELLDFLKTRSRDELVGASIGGVVLDQVEEPLVVTVDGINSWPGGVIIDVETEYATMNEDEDEL
jgi:hypothetical protein